jgi:AcrR family transcriptional regulator
MNKEKPSPSSTQATAAAGRYHHGDLKKSLIDAANCILQREGADALSLRAIAAEAGVSHTAPYSHFKNKKQLIEAVSEMGYELLGDALAVSNPATDFEDLALEYGVSYLKFALANPELYRLMLGQVETRGLKEPATLDLQRESITLKRPFLLLNNAFSKGVKNPEAAKHQALGAWALVHGLSALLIEGHLTLPEPLDLKRFLASVTLQRKA